MLLTKGQRYTWSEIVDETGADGSPPYYLLHRDGKVVAGCFTLELNPEAPLVVLAGDGPQVREWADLFCVQTGSIPVCVKSGLGEWLCCGNRIYSQVPAAVAWKVASRRGHPSIGDCGGKRRVFSRATERQPSSPRC